MSLFGGLRPPATQTQQQPAAGASLFGGMGASTTNNTASTQAGQTLGQGQTSTAPLSQSTAATSQSAYFDNLLERGKKRNKDGNATGQFGELPSLQLGLGDIARKVRNLGKGGPSAQVAQDSRAYVYIVFMV